MGSFSELYVSGLVILGLLIVVRIIVRNMTINADRENFDRQVVQVQRDEWRKLRSIEETERVMRTRMLIASLIAPFLAFVLWTLWFYSVQTGVALTSLFALVFSIGALILVVVRLWVAISDYRAVIAHKAEFDHANA